MHACLFVCLSVCVYTRAAADRFTYEYTKVVNAGVQDVSQGSVLPLIADGSCHLCYAGSYCWRADSAAARCEYLAETTRILTEDEVEEEDQGTGARIEVMDALGAVMNKAASDDRYQECIPHVSQYTDCHPGNICLGCKRCTCSVEGFWSCRETQQCTPTAQLEFEDDILNLVMEKLNAMYSSALGTRKKRAFRTRLRKFQSKFMNYDKPKPVRLSAGAADPTSTTRHTVTGFQQIKNESVTDLPKTNHSNNVTSARPATFLENESELLLMTDDMFKEIKLNLSVSSETNAVTTKKSDAEFNFDDLMDNDSDDNHRVNDSKIFDDKSYAASLKKKYDLGDLLKMLHDIYNTKDKSETNSSRNPNSLMETATIAYVNYDGIFATMPALQDNKMSKEYQTHSTYANEALPEMNKSRSQIDLHQHDYMDMSVNGKILDENNLSNNILNETTATDYNDFDDTNSVNVMKRDVNFVNDIPEDANSTQIFQNLNENVLQPLNNIIKEKQHEIEDLRRVREKLLDYLRTYTNNNISLNTNKAQLIEESNQFAVYQLAISPQSIEENTQTVETINNEFRRASIDRNSNQNQTRKYVMKLKRDIFEILKDIIAIKKLTKTEEPHELKLLTRALKFYIRAQTKKKSKFSQDKELLSWWNLQEKTRRANTDQPSTYIQDSLVQIFQILEKNTLQGNPLHSLSRETRKIIKRVIKDLVDKDSKESENWLEVNNPNYNVTDDFATFSDRFNKSLAEIKNASVFDIIDKMKMLHLILKSNVNRLRSAMLLFNIHKNRRKDQGKFDKHFEDSLRAIKKDVDVTKKLISRMFVDLDTSNYMKGFGKSRPKLDAIPKKESFMRYLKRILSKSKKGVLGIMHRATLPKDKNLELVTLNRLLDYEKTMRRWQNDLEVAPRRQRRSARRINNDVRSELKHILPKYLSGKVGPRIIAKVKANRINQRRYYVDRDDTFNSQRDDENDIKTRSMKNSDDMNSSPTEITADGNINRPNFVIMAPRKEGVRTKTETNIPYPPSDRILEYIT